ncbi:ribosomal subunit interface protein [Thermocladium modestius]|uniref:RNA 3'-terminal phosphate cyclase n=1 Tax=Thermocladium modestius TaxID=62609 RepID=A0A830GVM8_9CREN|nr:RNA 3'-terminal phosphate cyclase [Thermocladium modestius]GGP20669.1 ribosomal subunit interface protein [Thermocladium modestius]
MLEIDGSMGEGGGQVLRTAVALSAAMGVPVRIRNIRAKRGNPGLGMQHFTAVTAAAEISNAEVSGLRVGSTELTFKPGSISCRNRSFDVGTAGSVSLVIQTVLPILAAAGCESTIEIKGGTDVPMAPPIDYMANIVIPNLRLMGIETSIRVRQRGHYPRGGGLVELSIHSSKPRGLSLGDSQLERIGGISHATELPRHVAIRQANAASRALTELGTRVDIGVEVSRGLGAGSGVVVWALFSDGHRMGGDSLGERGKPAEQVGMEAARRLIEAVRSGAHFDPNMGDMLPTYAALSGEKSRYTVSQVTAHLVTNVEVVKLMGVDARLDLGRGMAEVIIWPHL